MPDLHPCARKIYGFKPISANRTPQVLRVLLTPPETDTQYYVIKRIIIK